MTARLFRILLAVQLLAAALVAWALWRGAGWAPLVAAVAALAGVLLVRALIAANNFVLSWHYRDRAASCPPLGWPARLRMFGTEYLATMLMSSWIMPRARAARRIWPAAATPPVLLVHGYGCNSGYWHHLTRELDALQVSHAGVDLEPMFADIDAFVPAVAQAVEELRAATGAPAITLVAHSMGGLVARAYMRACGTAHLARVITLGTPHHGTCLASFGIGRNAGQMRRGTDPGSSASPWLGELAASETPAERARIVSIYSCHDNIVAPHTSALLDGARNLGVSGIGHVALGRHPEVLALVRREILNATAPHMHF